MDHLPQNSEIMIPQFFTAKKGFFSVEILGSKAVLLFLHSTSMAQYGRKYGRSGTYYNVFTGLPVGGVVAPAGRRIPYRSLEEAPKVDLVKGSKEEEKDRKREDFPKPL